MIRLDVDRSAKILFDSGLASSLEEAEQKLSSLVLVVDVDAAAASTKMGQITFLTAINCGIRCFRGGVFVRGSLGTELLVNWPYRCTLRRAAESLGARIGGEPSESVVVSVGNNQCSERVGVRSLVKGFAGGSIPLDSVTEIGSGDFAPAAVLAAALCVSEAFNRCIGSRVACERTLGCDLVRLEGERDWSRSADDGSISYYRPDIWLVGLGHLGQAYAWTLSFLKAKPERTTTIVLQDYDLYRRENVATSLLGAETALNVRKARLCANWLEKRGFDCSIVERRFDSSTVVNTSPPPTEPTIALLGVDNIPTRRLISRVRGFNLIVDVGLGDTPQDYTAFFLHTFPGPVDSVAAFPLGIRPNDKTRAALLGSNNYRALRERDDCGTLLLADVAVGASFVGAAASAFAITQVLKFLSGFKNEALIDADIRRLGRLKSVPNEPLFRQSPYRLS